MYWMTLPLKRYFEFSGRSRRKEYWMYTLFTMIVSIVLGIVDGVLGLTIGGDVDASPFTNNGVLGSLFSLATLIPGIAVVIRRLHDVDRTGWWILFPLLTMIVGAVVGGALLGGFSGGDGIAGLGGVVGGVVLGAAVGVIVLFVFAVTAGTRGPNRFGDDPKDPVGDVAEVFR